MKTTEYLEINLTKEIKELHNKEMLNCLQVNEKGDGRGHQEMEQYLFLNRQKHYFKLAKLPTLVYRCGTVLIKIPAAFLTEPEETSPKFIQNQMGPRRTRAILGNRNKAGCIIQSSSYITKLQRLRKKNKKTVVPVQKQTCRPACLNRIEDLKQPRAHSAS